MSLKPGLLRLLVLLQEGLVEVLLDGGEVHVGEQGNLRPAAVVLDLAAGGNLLPAHALGDEGFQLVLLGGGDTLAERHAV
jgi:hypothetical protein